MSSLFSLLLGWLPAPLAAVCSGVIALFFFVAVLRLVAFILDIIPFL